MNVMIGMYEGCHALYNHDDGWFASGKASNVAAMLGILSRAVNHLDQGSTGARDWNGVARSVIVHIQHGNGVAFYNDYQGGWIVEATPEELHAMSQELRRLCQVLDAIISASQADGVPIMEAAAKVYPNWSAYR